MKKPFYKRKKFWLYSLAAYIVLGATAGAIGIMLGVEPQTEPQAVVQADKPAKSTETAAQQPETNPEPLEPAEVTPPTIESIVREIVGDEHYVSHESDEGVLYVNMVLADNLTADMAIKSAYDRIVEMSEQIRDNELLGDNNAVHYFFAADLTDAYGNVTSQNVLGVKLSAETLAKINFDNFSIDNLPAIADAHFRHAALNK